MGKGKQYIWPKYTVPRRRGGGVRRDQVEEEMLVPGALDAKPKRLDLNSAYSSERLRAGMGSGSVAVGRPLWH